MNKRFIWISIIAVFVSFFGGFLLANALNKNEIYDIRAENDRLKNSENKAAQNEAENSLSDEEIQQRIAQADRNPTDINFQKNLGMALYRYAIVKQDEKLLTEVARLLTRAYQSNDKDYDVAATLGNIYFDIGYLKKDDESFLKARDFYRQALKLKPGEVDARTDLGLTYFLINPPETGRAVEEFRKSLELNPAHEKTLQVIAQALISQNKYDEAGKYLAKLKEVNPDNQVLSELSARISAEKTGTVK